MTYSYGANKSVFTLTILAGASLLCVALLESWNTISLKIVPGETRSNEKMLLSPNICGLYFFYAGMVFVFLNSLFVRILNIWDVKLQIFCRFNIMLLYCENCCLVFQHTRYQIWWPHFLLLICLKVCSNDIYFAQKEPIKVKIFETFECSGQNLSNSLCQFWNKLIPLQILYPSSVSWKVTPLHFF